MNNVTHINCYLCGYKGPPGGHIQCKELYPLCKAAGLSVYPGGAGMNVYCFAADVEALLSAAPVVYGWTNAEINKQFWSNEPNTEGSSYPNSHTARLVCIEPIVRDTAESLLKELVDCTDNKKAYCGLVDRARQLLNKNNK